MDSVEGSLNEVFGGMLSQVERPVVTLPARDVTKAFVEAFGDADDTEAKLLLGTGLLSNLEWTTRSQLLAYQNAGEIEVREGSVTDVILAGPNTLGTLDAAAIPSLGFLGDHDHYEQYLDRWKQSERVAFETCGRGELIDTADAMLGEDAAETVATETDRAVRSSTGGIGGEASGRGCGSLDPISLLVWAGAEASVLGREVTDVVEELGLATRRTANRRIESLCEEGLIETQAVPETTPGHPDRRLELGVDVSTNDPIPSGLRDALTN